MNALTSATRVSRLVIASVLVGASLAACGSGELAGIPTAAPPADAGTDSATDGGLGDAKLDGDTNTGSPCATDLDCDDALACTADSCDLAAGRCVHLPNDASCGNGVYCDGDEICNPKLGCRPGEPVSCSDSNACTVDVCVEATRGCKHAPRDADGDGDPDIHCGGGDCNDLDPSVASTHAEICGNAVDDNCNGQIDEGGCIAPAHDNCGDALLFPGSATIPMSTVGAKLDIGASCGPVNPATTRDVVAAIKIPPGPPMRIDASVSVSTGSAAVALSLVCGMPSQELACGKSGGNGKGGQTARARAYSVPPGAYPIVVYTDTDTTALVTVTLSPAGVAPTNETCGTAQPIASGETILVPLVGATPDVATKCGGATSDLVYRVELDKEYDVRAFASTVDGMGSAAVSLRRSPCTGIENEVACATGNPVTAFARKLGPGPVFVAVKASLPTDVSLLVTLAPPTPSAPDETCSGSPALVANVDNAIDLTDHIDDINACTLGLIDAAYAIELTQPSDVLAILRVSQSDDGAISIMRPPCESKDEVLACKAKQESPMRVAAHGLKPGQYRLVVELADGSPATVTPLVRPAAAPTVVAFADTCADAFVIPPTGGTFQGNTSNANAQYSAGCDQGGGGPFGAPEQMLRLDLPEKRRVVFDMAGSSYATLLDIRRGPSCPGTEVLNGCTIGYSANRSFLDILLEPGTYFIQVDGTAGQSGAWTLDVFVLP